MERGQNPTKNKIMNLQPEDPCNDIPEDFLCPITQELFRDPVQDMFGHTYERSAILHWLGAHGTCPMTRKPMKPSDLIPNILMRTKIRLWARDNNREEMIVKCGNKESGESVIGYYSFNGPSRPLTDDDIQAARARSFRSDHLVRLLAEYVLIERWYDEEHSRQNRRQRGVSQNSTQPGRSSPSGERGATASSSQPTPSSSQRPTIRSALFSRRRRTSAAA